MPDPEICRRCGHFREQPVFDLDGSFTEDDWTCSCKIASRALAKGIPARKYRRGRTPRQCGFYAEQFVACIKEKRQG